MPPAMTTKTEQLEQARRDAWSEMMKTDGGTPERKDARLRWQRAKREAEAQS